MDTFCVSSRDRKYFVKSIINSDIQRIKYQNEIISFIQSKRIKTAEQCKIHKSKNGNLFAVRPWIDGTTIDVFDKSSIVKISEIISIMHSYKINGINLWHYNNLENLSNPKWLFIKYQIYRTGIDQLRPFFSAAFTAIETAKVPDLFTKPVSYKRSAPITTRFISFIIIPACESVTTVVLIRC